MMNWEQINQVLSNLSLKEPFYLVIVHVTSYITGGALMIYGIRWASPDIILELEALRNIIGIVASSITIVALFFYIKKLIAETDLAKHKKGSKNDK